jgi:hypothetical protein
MAKQNKYDFIIQQGANFTKNITWQDSDGQPIDLTNYTARMKAKRNYSSENEYFSLTHESGITLGGAEGTVVINMTPAETAALSFDTAVYDLELVSSGGNVKRLLEGVITLSKEVTK